MNETPADNVVSGALARNEWDFDGVPDDELDVCQFWEYARESLAIRTLCERTRRLDRNKNRNSPERLPVEEEFDRLFSRYRRRAILFQENIYGFEGTRSVDEFPNPFPQPWQSLSTHQRGILIATARWNGRELVGTPPFRRGCSAIARALGKIEAPMTIAEAFGKDRITCEDMYHGGDKFRQVTPHLLAGGTESLAVEIDWGESTDEEIISAFRKWLKENSPPGVRRPDRRGRKLLDYRASLDRLGIMRLLHSQRRAEIPAREPEAHRRFGSRDWYKERKRAAECFRELFSFFAKEDPLSWITKSESSK